VPFISTKRMIQGGALVAYVATIFAANWAIQRFGVIPVGFELLAPAGVYFVGVAFPLRDFIQRTMGRGWGVAAILVGAGLSYLVAPTFAVASGATFLVSESVDMAVYTRLQKRFAWAVVLSSLSALVVDSALFLWLAFGSEAFLQGQIFGKAQASAFGAAVVILLWARRQRLALVPA
jgi:uncharacterized PurR-regulated membrane protein YhhQ (DUF165 family)